MYVCMTLNLLTELTPSRIMCRRLPFLNPSITRPTPKTQESDDENLKNPRTKRHPIRVAQESDDNGAEHPRAPLAAGTTRQ